MDAKVTLSFDQEVIEKAKKFAERHNISLSRLTELLLRRTTETSYPNLEDIPISAWVTELAEGKAEYKKRGKKKMKDEYFDSRK